MNLVSFLKLIYSKLTYIIFLPIIFGFITFLITRDLPDRYTSTATLFTGVTSNTGLEMMGTRIDNIQTLNEYNNILSIIKSRALAEETSLRLLTQHLLQDSPNPLIINNEAFQTLLEEIAPKIQNLIVKGNSEQSYVNLKHSASKDRHGFLYKLLNGDHPYYSVNAINKLSAERIGASDLIKISYTSYDPAITYNTIKLATEIFNNRYIGIKKSQSNNAVTYFQNKLKEVKEQLEVSEQNLLEYNIANNIINYGEQTEQITTQQEAIELKMQELKMNYEAAGVVYRKLEEEIKSRYKINLQNQQLTNIRSKLIETNNEIAQLQVYNKGESSPRMQLLQNNRKQLEKHLNNQLDSTYLIDSKTYGIDFQHMMTEWINALLNYESNATLYKSMLERHREFMGQYKLMAPVGATIKRLEREIDVIEAQYLNIQHNLNIALQKEQNMALVSDMKMMDEASLPLLPDPSKNKLYVLIVAVFSILLYIAALLVIQVLDMRIKTTENLSQLSGLEVIGAFCPVQKNKLTKAAQEINLRSSVYIYEKICKLSADSNLPFIIQIISIWDNAGKLETANHIKKDLQQRHLKVKLFNFSTNKKTFKDEIQTLVTSEETQMLHYLKSSSSYAELFSYLKNKPDIILSILPSISHGIDNALLAKSAHMNIVVVDSLLTWHKAETLFTEKLKNLVDYNLFAVLTNGRVEHLEDMFGEIPKNRSFLRKKIKAILTRFTGQT